jgi:hypothetical protein
VLWRRTSGGFLGGAQRRNRSGRGIAADKYLGNSTPGAAFGSISTDKVSLRCCVGDNRYLAAALL